MPFFSRLEPTVVGLEACGSAHHWARVLGDLGHEVKLIAPQHVKPYLKRNKNDARDAEAGCEAMSRPHMRYVPVKSAEAQGALMLMRTRERLVKTRTQLTNAIRGHAAEFGLIAPKGLVKVGPLLTQAAEDESLPALARRMFAEMATELDQVNARLRRIEAELMAWHRAHALSRELARIDSVGPIGASMLVLKTPDPNAFKSGRDFAAWLGLTPKDHSTAGRQRLGGITRAGDEALRSVLVVGATAVIRQVRAGRGRPPSPWLVALLQRKPPKLAAVALANKVARIAWAIMARGETFDRNRFLGSAQAA